MTIDLVVSARHSKASPRWGTPVEYVERARAALGGRIELDPMSEEAFNRTVCASRIFTESDACCFTSPWTCETMLLNPAGGLVVPAWRKLVEEYAAGRTNRAVWIGFSVEQFNLLADDYFHPFDYSILIVRQRIDFLTLHPLRDVVGRDGAEALLECGHRTRVAARKTAAPKRYRCSTCVGDPEANGSPSHGNYVVGLGIRTDVFESAFAGCGRFDHGRLAVR